MPDEDKTFSGSLISFGFENWVADKHFFPFVTDSLFQFVPVYLL